MKVKDVMVKDIVTINPNSSILEAIKKMHYDGITSLLVQDKNTREYGIITRKDIIHQIIALNKDPDKLNVSDVMSTPLVAVSSDLDLEGVAMLMAKTDIRRFPVMDGGKLVGLISNSDILKAYINED
jgi:CBS domain-containing protein